MIAFVALIDANTCTCNCILLLLDDYINLYWKMHG